MSVSDKQQQEQQQERLQKIWLLSDTVLYPEAVAFLQKLVEEEEWSALPSSQVAGLFNVAQSAKYADLYEFVKHQRDRNWPSSRSDIKKFYTALERYLTDLQKRRLKDEFHLLEGGQEANEMLVLLTREFIQHLLAENGLLALRERARRR